MRWLNRDTDSGACSQPPDLLTHWLHSTHWSSLQIPPAPSLSRCQGTKEEKLVHLMAAGSTCRELTPGTAHPKPSSRGARCSPPALAHPGSAPAEGRWCCARLLSAHFFWGTCAATEEEVNPATTPRDTLTIYCNTALCVKAQLSHTEAKPPWAAAPTDKFVAGLRQRAAQCWGLLRLPRPHRSGSPHVLCPNPRALQPHSAAGTAARAAL